MSRKVIFIIFILILGIGLLYLAKTLVIGKNQHNSSKKSVKGANTQKETIFQKKLDDIKQEVSKLNIPNIISSSPQFKKVVKDFNFLKEFPSREIKGILQKIKIGL